MSQTDLNVANASGAAVRADLNAHLDALVSLSAGAVAPSTTFPNQWWYDTSVSQLKKRNNANTAWLSTPQIDTVLDTNGNAINESEGTAVASAATTDIWVTDGNTVHVTGTTTITSFGTAPRVGAWRKVIFDGILTLTDGANLNIIGNANITTASDDWAWVYAETTTLFKVLYIKADGTAVASSGFASGTTMLFHQSAAPTGWTKDVAAALDNAALRVVTSTAWASGKQGATAFTTVFGAGKTAGPHTLSTAESASHTHDVSIRSTVGGSTLFVERVLTGTAEQTVTAKALATGGGGSHDHTLSLDLNYINMIIATKD